MKKKRRASVTRKLDKLAEIVRGIPPERIEEVLGRTERLNFLLTPLQKESVRAAADRYGLSMTDYLMRLHELVEQPSRSTSRSHHRR